MIYLDNAATTLIKPPHVAQAVYRAVSSLSTPGRGSHKFAFRAAEAAYNCREAAAKLFHSDNPENIVFCQNATHALNIAIKSMVRAGDTVVTSGYEHNAVMRPLHALGARVVPAEAPLFDRAACLSAFDEALKKGARLCIVNQVSNVFGFIQPVSEIAELCRRRSIPLIIDASQSAGILDINAEALGAAFIAMPGHKGLYGPQGTGLLICSSQTKTLIEGGTGSNSRQSEMPDFLPDRLEAGTHNMPGIAGLKEGLDFINRLGTDRILEHEKKLLRHAIDRLRDIKGIKLYASEDEAAQCGVLSFEIEGYAPEEAAVKLSEKGFALRAGLHCAPQAHKTAGTYQKGTLRMSFSVFNTSKEINKLSHALVNLDS